MLTDDEAVAVVLGLIAADRLGLGAETPAAAAAEAKIARVLPPALADRLAALRATLGFTMRGVDPGVPGHRHPADPGRGHPGPAAGDDHLPGRPARGTSTPTAWSSTADAGTPSATTTAATRSARSGSTGSSPSSRPATSFEPPPGFDAVEHLNRQFAAMDWQWEVEVLIEADLDTAAAAGARRTSPS